MVKREIESRLREAFALVHMEVEDESHRHNVPPGAQSHFKVTVVSEDFSGVRPVARHQRIYALLTDLMAGSVHALALHIYTPEEWQALEEAPQSPRCLGGDRS